MNQFKSLFQITVELRNEDHSILDADANSAIKPTPAEIPKIDAR